MRAVLGSPIPAWPPCWTRFTPWAVDLTALGDPLAVTLLATARRNRIRPQSAVPRRSNPAPMVTVPPGRVTANRRGPSVHLTWTRLTGRCRGLPRIPIHKWPRRAVPSSNPCTPDHQCPSSDPGLQQTSCSIKCVPVNSSPAAAGLHQHESGRYGRGSTVAPVSQDANPCRHRPAAPVSPPETTRDRKGLGFKDLSAERESTRAKDGQRSASPGGGSVPCNREPPRRPSPTPGSIWTALSFPGLPSAFLEHHQTQQIREPICPDKNRREGLRPQETDAPGHHQGEGDVDQPLDYSTTRAATIGSQRTPRRRLANGP